MTDLRITEAFLYMDYLLLEAGRESFVCVLSIVLWTGCHHLTFFIWRRVERKRNENKCFRALCCKGPPPARPEYDLVCIGLTGSGKTSLLSKLCSESPDNVVSTTGFSIKAVPFQNAILNVKELGGADNIRKYWSRYYQGSQGVIFVLDSASSEDDLETARNELHSALQHPQLCTLPFLILANHQDKPAARSVQETPNLSLAQSSSSRGTCHMLHSVMLSLVQVISCFWLFGFFLTQTFSASCGKNFFLKLCKMILL
ncbi:ADP-ribosylation factor-like protein 15 isoform X2 [Pteropus medius]|uniref:ADP-ribosylation factor-like protein 15 isoform X2 n=1 Tax=Pteropus vampyrus TaxID=132908 RepID=UPI00196A892D|nr:ADP-ribosylation factor-like protein 15 isoform X2 [Pteropus giganteus]